MMDRAEFDRVVGVALEAATAEHTFVSVSDERGGTTRFANNQVTQNVNTRRRSVNVSAAFGQQRGSASTTELSDDAVRDAVRRAEAIARVSPADPEFQPPLPPQKYPVLATLRADTAAAGPGARLAAAATAIEQCQAAGMEAAGIVGAYISAVGLAASSGLRAFEQRGRAQFSLTATAADSSGWVNVSSRSFADLDAARQTRTAIEKARASAAPREIPAGRYTVILEPAAAAGFVGPLFSSFDAKSYFKGTSPLAGKLGERIVDARLTLQNRPDHPALLGDGFDGQGLPGEWRTWIESGVLRSLAYDRFTAQERGVAPTGELDAPHLAGTDPAAAGVDELVRATQRGILVTNFWYIRDVNRTELNLTGMTRDGTFLIEDGRIAGGLINFRWHDSPLRGLNALDGYTRPLDAITMERDKMMLPALRIREFNFSSVTRF